MRLIRRTSARRWNMYVPVCVVTSKVTSKRGHLQTRSMCGHLQTPSPPKSRDVQNMIWTSSLYVLSFGYALGVYWIWYQSLIGTILKISRVKIKGLLLCMCLFFMEIDRRERSRKKNKLSSFSTRFCFTSMSCAKKLRLSSTLQVPKLRDNILIYSS